MKTAEELKELKEKIQALSEKLASLTPEELKQVLGGAEAAPDNRVVVNGCPYCKEAGGFHKLGYAAPDREHWHCDTCGDMTYFRYEYRWERGLL